MTQEWKGQLYPIVSYIHYTESHPNPAQSQCFLQQSLNRSKTFFSHSKKHNSFLLLAESNENLELIIQFQFKKTYDDFELKLIQKLLIEFFLRINK